MSTAAAVSIGVGFDTARYGHHVSFLRRIGSRPPRRSPSPSRPQAMPNSARPSSGSNRNSDAFTSLYVLTLPVSTPPTWNNSSAPLPWQKTISVGQPKQNRDYRNVHFPKRKADAVDAQACARFAIVEQPAPTPETPPEFAQLRELAGALESQVKQTTRLVNQLHNRLARIFPELALHVPDLSAGWVLQLLAKYPSPAKIAAAHLSSLVAIPHLTEDKARKIQAAARQTVASLQGPVVEGLIRQSVETIRHGQKTTAS